MPVHVKLICYNHKESDVALEVIMQRILWLTVALSLLVLTYASAEIFRCRTPDGVLVMTDRETELPADCQLVDEPAGKGSFNVVPSAETTDTKRPLVPFERGAATKRQDIAPWQKDSSALVERYNDALRRRNRESLEVDRLRATREIGQLKQQKDEMLNDIKGSGLRHEDQQAIRKTLDKIPKR
jgi:hypothetical protein